MTRNMREERTLIFSSMSPQEVKYRLLNTPYYAHIEYNDKTDPDDGLPDEDVNAIDEIPVYSINKPKDESLVISP
jgi:hypothetical protein